MSTPDAISRRQRGATIVGYALVAAAILLGSVAGIDKLTEDSGAFLERSGQEVARPIQPGEADADELAAPSDWTTVPEITTTTFPAPEPTVSSSVTTSPQDLYRTRVEDVAIMTSGGSCLDLGGPTLTQHPCDSANSAQKFAILEAPDGKIRLTDAQGNCLGPLDLWDGALVGIVPCSDPMAAWGMGTSYPAPMIHEASTLANGWDMCLDVFGGSNEPGTTIGLWWCHLGPRQLFSL